MAQVEFSQLALLSLLLLSAGPAISGEKTVEYRPGGPPAKKMWDQFYKEPGHEPELDDPLIQAGKKMTGNICAAIAHPDMKRRRYAIGALGFIGDRQAIPTLETILKNPKEIEDFRGDALQSIYHMDAELGTKYANEFKESSKYLKLISNAIINKEAWLTAPTEEQ